MAQDIAFETPRLKVEGWDRSLASPEGRRALADQLRPVLTPAVLAHLPPPLQLADTDAAIADWIDDRAAESDVLTIRDADGALLGLMILAPSPSDEYPPTVHLGYLLSQGAWGKGYATELVAGLISWYRGEGDAVQLFGGVGRENPGSARVLVKNGFALQADASDPETEMYGLYIPTDYDRLYQTTKDALGTPGPLIVDFFERQSAGHLRVLDIGCGQGRDAKFIARLGHTVVGVDLSPAGIADMLADAKRENLPIEGVVADIVGFEPAGNFDVIVVDRTLHMLADTDWEPVLKRLMAHVKPRGWIIIIDEPENMPAFKTISASGEHQWDIETEAAAHLVLRRSA